MTLLRYHYAVHIQQPVSDNFDLWAKKNTHRRMNYDRISKCDNLNASYYIIPYVFTIPYSF